MVSRVVLLLHLILGVTFSQIVLDPANAGRTYNGIGGLSGGGATSRLLIDYPEPYRSQVLDLLFLPQFGASLQILKVEIGGDAFSSCGTEPSHMHDENLINYEQGYEWWLMVEAKKRNPSITTYGLPWGFPGWIGDGNNGRPLNENQAIYQTNFVLGAKERWNVDIDYLGIWNEIEWTPDYVKLLRKTLDENNLNDTKIVLGDLCCGGSDWDTMAEAMLNDTVFREAVAVMGEHYPVASLSTPLASSMGIPLWSSEDDSTFWSPVGIGCLARIINWNYVNGNMTATIIWNLITSYYEGLFWWGDSFMDASKPWSGFYDVKGAIWVAAHTTQFATPGWVYLQNDTGSGFLDLGGSYATLVSPEGRDFSIVIETMSTNNSQCIRCNPDWGWAVAPQNITFELSGTLASHKTLYVWQSRLFGNNVYFFEQQKNIVPMNGVFTVYVEPDSVVTITSTTGQQKGSFPPPPSNFPFPIPYKEDFDHYKDNSMPRYFSDMTGSFSIHAEGKGNKVYRQFTRQLPISWCSQGESLYPVTIIGDYNMTNYRVELSFFIEENPNNTVGRAALGARVGQGYCNTWYNVGYYLIVTSKGQWYLLAGQNNTIAQGTVQGNFYQTWHTMSLEVNNMLLIGQIDGNPVFEIVDGTFSSGWAAIGSGWHYANFDHFGLHPPSSNVVIPM